MAHVWREALRKTSEGKHIDEFRRHIEASCPGGANSMLRLFKEFRRKSGSGDNVVDLPEFGRALKACSIYMTDQEVKRLFAELDTNDNRAIDQDEFAAYVIGRYDELGAASGSGYSIGAIGENSRKTADDWHFQTKRAGPAPPPAKGAAVDTSVWLGKIPHGLCHVSAAIGAEGLNRRGPVGLAGCFLALDSGLRLVGTVSSRR